MSNILRKPTSVNEESKGRYEKFNLKENPFPSTPAINKLNKDIRYNGKIYESKIRESEFKKIETDFLKVSQNDPNHIRLGFIIDDSYVGRGNGKSAFSLELMRRINRENLLDISEGVNKCFCVHISPEPSGRTKSFYSLVDLMFEGILSLHYINYCLAVLRLEAIISARPDFKIEDAFSNDEELVAKLNSREWFEDENIEIAPLTSSIYFSNQHISKTSPDFPLVKDKKSYFQFRVSTEEEFKNYYYQILKKGKERIDFFYNDLVLLFKAAGFNGAYFIIDDFERIPDFQSDRAKRDFALELRTNFFDGISENAKSGFYNLLLILHAGVPRLIEKAWSDTGMERRSPLSADNLVSRHVVIFNKLNVDHAELLLKRYLEEYRINPQQENELFPFTKEAISIISEKAELNAASILEKAHSFLEKAVESNKDIVDEEFVNQILGEKKEEKSDIVSKPDDDKSVNLFDKASDL
ncbi:MAG: hypothetical protein QM768_02860 [Agriterribacter sp.]